MAPSTPSVPTRMPTTMPLPPPLTTPPHPQASITTNPKSLRKMDTSAPILRFDFPTAAAQASFHRAFSMLKTQKDKAAFIARFFDNYDGQVSIPKVPVRWDTSKDEDLAKELWDEAVPPPTDDDEHLARLLHADAPPPPTHNDIELARRLQNETPLPVTSRDADLARMLQDETPLPVTSRDAEFARMLQDETSLPLAATHLSRDEALARRMQEEINRANELERDFGRMTFADRRRQPEQQQGRDQRRRPEHPHQYGRRTPRETREPGAMGPPPGWQPGDAVGDRRGRRR